MQVSLHADNHILWSGVLSELFNYFKILFSVSKYIKFGKNEFPNCISSLSMFLIFSYIFSINVLYLRWDSLGCVLFFSKSHFRISLLW